MAAKRSQTRTEEEIEQLLLDKSLKCTNEVFNEVLTFVIWNIIFDLRIILYADYWNL